MTRPRDSKRAKVYAAERKAFRFVAAARPAAGFETVELCQRYVNEVWDHSLGYGDPPKVKDGRGSRSARAGAWEVNLPLWGRRPWVILHELAHACNSRHDRSRKAAHGPEWAGLYLHLVRRHISEAAFHELARAFEAANVPYDLMKKAASR